MARKIYRHSDQTFMALAGHEPAIAEEHGCDPSYIYGIKNRKHPDPYSPFRELYRATARGGGDTSHWRNDLDAIDASVAADERVMDLPQLLINKIRVDGISSEELAKAIADGSVDAAEAQRIIKLMRQVKDDADSVITQCVNRLAELAGEIESQSSRVTKLRSSTETGRAA